MQPPPFEAFQQQFQTLLRQDVPWLLMGTVLLTLSASAIALFCWRWKVRDLALLWFGLFSGLYALRLLASVRTVRVLAGLNRVLCAQLDGQFVTAAYLFLDLEARSALYSSAGHPPLLLWRSSERQVLEFQEGGLLLGFMPHADYPVAELPVQPGDRLLLYTDGILEAPNPAGDFFGPDRLRDFIATHTHLAAEPFADALLARLAAWSSRRQDDDLTLVVADFYWEEGFSDAC
jgi:serine phosphatase RsbU (regulator of sigma subunit)